MRISRRLRGILAAAVTTGALLALPGAASAAADLTITVTKSATTPSIEPGAVVKYDVTVENTGMPAGAVAGDGGTITLDANFDNADSTPITIAGGVEVATGGTNDDFTAIGADGRSIDIIAGFDNSEPVTFTFDVTLPNRRVTNTFGSLFEVTASANDTDLGGFNEGVSTGIELYKGDPAKTSKLYATWSQVTSAPAGLGDWWAPKDSTVSAVLTIHNWGDGSAYGVDVDPSDTFFTSPVQPNKPKADLLSLDFEPKATIVGSADCVANADSTECSIGEIPAGGSKSVQVNVTGLTHLGATGSPNAFWGGGTLEKNRSTTSPNWNDTDNFTGTRDAADVKITDGKTVLPRVSLDGPTLGAGRTDIAYPFEIVNAGPDAITGSVLRVDATVFNDKGAEVGGAHAGDTGVIESIKSITLSNGSTCSPAIDHTNYNGGLGKYEPKARIGTWDCGIADIAPNVRVTGTVVANFATGRVDSTVTGDPVSWGSTGTNGESASVSLGLHTAQFNQPSSATSAWASTRLNRAASADLDVSVKSAAQIGSERLGLHVVTIKNNGPSTAKNVALTGAIYKLAGKFEPTLLPGSCTGVVVSSDLACSIGDIASGASVNVTVPVLGPKKIGSSFVANYTVSSWEYDANDDNNSVSHVQTVVKAALAPYQGVRIVRAPGVLKQRVLGRTGLKSTVTVPGASVVIVDLQVSRVIAQKMGLVKAPKRGTRRAKKLPAFIKIGTGRKVMKASGKAVVFTKLTRAYKLKVLKLRKPLKVQRVVKVTSTASLTRGATHMATHNLTIRK